MPLGTKIKVLHCILFYSLEGWGFLVGVGGNQAILVLDAAGCEINKVAPTCSCQHSSPSLGSQFVSVLFWQTQFSPVSLLHVLLCPLHWHLHVIIEFYFIF